MAVAGNLKTNKKSPSTRLSPGLVRMFLLLLLIFLVEFFFHTWCGVQCIRTGYEITAAEKRQEELLEMQKSLQVELARLTAPQSLSRAAARQFNLRTPEPEQMVVLP
ncbi:MAG: hypothetical protein R6X08_07305 [Desulfosalsimonadaceae bacterium]